MADDVATVALPVGIFVTTWKREHSFVRTTAEQTVYGPFTVEGPTLDAIVRQVLTWLELDVLPAHLEGAPCRVVGNEFVFVSNGSIRGGVIVDDDSLMVSALYRRVPRPAPLDINSATVQALAVVPGLNAAKAAAIVAHRESAGPFASVDDLLTVTSIKKAALAKARPWLCTGL